MERVSSRIKSILRSKQHLTSVQHGVHPTPGRTPGLAWWDCRSAACAFSGTYLACSGFRQSGIASSYPPALIGVLAQYPADCRVAACGAYPLQGATRTHTVRRFRLKL